MRALLLAASAAVLVLVAVLTTEGAAAVLFGWVPFLGRVLPRVTVDGPSVAVGMVAAVLLAAGIHWLGCAACGETRRWRVRCTAAAVLGVLVLFAAGISVVGVVHQVGWLATADRPLVGVGLKRSSHPENEARMIGLGLAYYADTYRTLPAGGTFAPDGGMRHSWETAILPFIGYSISGIDLGRPWNDPVNQPAFKCVLPAFINPGFRTPPLEDGDGYGLSHYAANGRVLGANTAVAVAGLSNGASNTILVGEVNAGFRPWGHPVNWRDPVTGRGNSAAGFGGPPRTGGVLFVVADGSVRFVSDRTSPEVLRGLSGP